MPSEPVRSRGESAVLIRTEARRLRWTMRWDGWSAASPVGLACTATVARARVAGGERHWCRRRCVVRRVLHVSRPAESRVWRGWSCAGSQATLHGEPAQIVHAPHRTAPRHTHDSAHELHARALHTLRDHAQRTADDTTRTAMAAPTPAAAMDSLQPPPFTDDWAQQRGPSQSISQYNETGKHSPALSAPAVGYERASAVGFADSQIRDHAAILTGQTANGQARCVDSAPADTIAQPMEFVGDPLRARLDPRSQST